MSEEEAQAEGVSRGSSFKITPPVSGYAFDPADAFSNKIPDTFSPKTRAEIIESMRNYAKSTDRPFMVSPSNAAPRKAVAKDLPEAQKIDDFIRENLPVIQDQRLAKTSSAPAQFPIGKLSPEVMQSLGLEEGSDIVLNRGSSREGLLHMKAHHTPEMESGETAKVLRTVLADPKARYSLAMQKNKADFINVFDDKKSMIVTLHRNATSGKWEVVAAHHVKPGSNYIDKRTVLR